MHRALGYRLLTKHLRFAINNARMVGGLWGYVRVVDPLEGIKDQNMRRQLLLMRSNTGSVIESRELRDLLMGFRYERVEVYDQPIRFLGGSLWDIWGTS